ncbi:hypothetical protein DI270_013605 [Microbispora triticiradicis]|uniref:Uncharacterized protein n=1 Tax=Microbispora triticiradicis TaxID=2200763 RepID=A0ABX9LKP2_9ACTN|nr:hypothetical protein [Microbispora triticiradicis]RGA04515.1 hypothetical protein DI270_013605 [Microbispora triticiradicis]
MKTGNWSTRHDEGHALRMAIGDLARAAAAPEWTRLVARHAEVGSHAVTTLLRDGREISAEGMREPFRRLRELSYQADTGTWFTCELAFEPGSRRYTCRAGSAEPPFVDVPAAAALAELTTFFRETPPGWLLAALPTAPPLPLPFGHGERYEGWSRRDFGDRRPRRPLPISGEVTYVPDTAMTARAMAYDRERGGHLVYLAERDGDPESGFLMVTSSRDTWYVGREGMRGAGEGVRAVTLDGSTLRLELTPEAADLLETEQVFEIRLELPPESAAELRAVLPRMLRPVAGAPDLSGF